MERDELIQKLQSRIEDTKSYKDKPPCNETNTCNHVILPLLYAAGYKERDIQAERYNGANGIPDYTILEDTDNTWYLEAKDWNKKLRGGPEIAQALNYANTNGHRWAVLTNGHEWILLDNHMQGVEAGKRVVAEADINNESRFLDFMLAISKDSVESRDLEKYAVKQRLPKVLKEQLLDPDSETIDSILQYINKQQGMHLVSSTDISGYFRKNLGGKSEKIDTQSNIEFQTVEVNQQITYDYNNLLDSIIDEFKELNVYTSFKEGGQAPKGYRYLNVGYKGAFVHYEWLIYQVEKSLFIDIVLHIEKYPNQEKKKLKEIIELNIEKINEGLEEKFKVGNKRKTSSMIERQMQYDESKAKYYAEQMKILIDRSWPYIKDLLR